MKNNGVSVEYVTFHKPQRTDIKSYYIDPSKNFVSKLRMVRKTVRIINPSVLHAHQVIGHGMWGALSGYHPFVVSAWGTDIEILANQSWLNRSIAKYVIKKADIIHVPAKSMVATVKKLGCPKEKIFIQIFGSDTKVFNPDVREETLKKRYNSDYLVISIRVLDRIYKVDTLIRTIPIIIKKFPRTKFLILGKGEQRQYLEKLALQLGVIDNTVFMGWRERHEIPRYLSSSDIYVDTLAASAGISIGLLEAMSCGLPPVVAKIPGVDEAVEDGVNGLIFPPGDHEALARKILELLSDDSRRKQMGAAARKTAVEIGDIDKCMRRIEGMYESLLKR
jgi:glycosyltransferase involved in cell wall biosynthesis